MDKVNQYAFYELGESLGHFRELTDKADQADLVIAVWSIEQAFTKFLVASARVPLTLSKRLAQKVIATFSNVSEASRGDGWDWGKKVTSYQLKTLTEVLTEFETVLSNEAQGLDVFSVSQKQAYSMTTLIERGEEVLPESVRNVLSEFTINEIREATKCIAFDLPTAGGFHLLRGLESALRDYFDQLSGGAPRPTTKHGKDVPMGDYINEVEKLNAQEKVISVLRQIKTLHRDPHMHPESVFHMDGAVMLLGVITSAIWMMFNNADESDLSADDVEDAADAAAMV